ncbi:MAG: ABC transporter substrate-binding protein [Bacillota bacterium]|nr:ABC transporter substrate-binding protein [Bacillota bacterium]MDW7684916.1 ABC transporter substrate-binding protein [Bacillota bacterium]
MKRKQFLLVIVSVLIFAALLTGCGTTETDNQNEAQPEPSTRVFAHYMGETEIPVEPKRVIALDYVGHVLAAGVVPVGVNNWNLDNPYFQPYFAGVEGLGEDEPNLEKILSLKPDLILGAEWNEEIYEDLSKIAPTVLIPWMEHDVNEHLAIVADVLGKQAEAEAWLKSFEDLAQQKSQEMRNYVAEDETVLIFRIYPDSFSVYGDRNMGHVFYRGLGLTPPQGIQELIGDEVGKLNQHKISLEVLPEFSGDHLIVMVNDLAEAETQLAEIQKTMLWQNLPAVQNDKVYYIERGQWLSYDPVSIMGQLEDAVGLFKDE